MALTEQEQRVLDELERSLTRDDRRLAQKLSGHGQRRPYGRIAVLTLGVLAGLGILVLGAIQENTWLGIAGFGLMFAVLAWGISERRANSYEYGTARPTKQTPKVYNQMNANLATDNKSGFMDRLEDRWERRQSENR